MDKTDNREIFLYISIAYIFSVAVRFIWFFQVKDISSFYWHDQIMINTNDGYFFASGIKNLLNHDLVYNQRVPGYEYGLVSFTYLLTKILPFSLDSIILFLPVFISSLVVIPIIMTMKLYNKPFLGFLSAILASVTWSFYNRTMMGYYDTDLFALVFPVFVVYFLIKSIKEESLFSLFVASLITALYFYAYDASKPVIFALALGFMGYLTIFLKDKEIFLPFLTLYTTATVDIDWRFRLILILVVYVVFSKKIIKDKVSSIVLAVIFLTAFFYFNHVFALIYSKVYEYIQTGVQKDGSLEFFQVHQTIREAGKIPFKTFANRILGYKISFILGVAGYILLVLRKKEFLLFLPLVGIGFFAYMGGLRFTVYAIPAMAIGAIYLFYFATERFFKDTTVKKVLLGFITILFLIPNILHIIDYKVPTVFTKPEVEVLDRLKKISSNKDYTLSWWDYGYPIWYYSDTNTLIDGGKHHQDNFIISQILTSSSQTQVANLSRLSVEKYTHNKLGYSPVAIQIFKDKDPNTLLEELKNKSFKVPQKSVDVFLYLPNRLLNIFATVDLFSNLDLKTGLKKHNTFFYMSRNFMENSTYLQLGDGLVFDKEHGLLTIGKSKVPIKSITTTEYNTQNKLQTATKELYPDGKLYMIFMKNYHQILILDERLFKSAFIQMFVLEDYDKSMFEPVIMTPYAKVYKLKR